MSKPTKSPYTMQEKILSLKKPTSIISEADRDKNRANLKGETQLLTDISFKNDLPPLPFEPVLLDIPINPSDYTQYKTLALEKNYPYSIHNDPVNFHANELLSLMFIDSQTEGNTAVSLAPEDEDLFTEQDKKYVNADSIVSDATWLKNTTYLENNLDAPVSIADPKQLVEEEIKQVKSEIDSVRGNRTLTQVIDDSFKLAKKTPVSSKGLKPVAVWDVLPNIELSKREGGENSLIHFKFDDYPGRDPESSNGMVRDEKLNYAIVKPHDENAESNSNKKKNKKNKKPEIKTSDSTLVVHYMVPLPNPTPDCVQYQWIREYKLTYSKESVNDPDRYVFQFNPNEEKGGICSYFLLGHNKPWKLKRKKPDYEREHNPISIKRLARSSE